METIQELIAAYLPTISSIAAIIIAILTFFTKVKELVGSSMKENDTLKQTIEKIMASNEDYKTLTNSYNDSIQKTISQLTEELAKTKAQLASQEDILASMNKIKDSYIEVVDELNTVRRQLTRVIKENEEA